MVAEAWLSGVGWTENVHLVSLKGFLIITIIAKLSLPASKSWVALSSLVRSFVVRSSVPHGNISTVWCFRQYNLQTILFLKALRPRISKLVLPSVPRTNTQIQHMKKCQKDPICGIFLKWGLFKNIKNYIAMCQTPKYKNTNLEYTNTAYEEMPERSNMCYIFEKRIVQRYLLSLAQLYKV